MIYPRINKINCYFGDEAAVYQDFLFLFFFSFCEILFHRYVDGSVHKTSTYTRSIPMFRETVTSEEYTKLLPFVNLWDDDAYTETLDLQKKSILNRTSKNNKLGTFVKPILCSILTRKRPMRSYENLPWYFTRRIYVL